MLHFQLCFTPLPMLQTSRSQELMVPHCPISSSAGSFHTTFTRTPYPAQLASFTLLFAPKLTLQVDLEEVAGFLEEFVGPDLLLTQIRKIVEAPQPSAVHENHSVVLRKHRGHATTPCCLQCIWYTGIVQQSTSAAEWQCCRPLAQQSGCAAEASAQKRFRSKR